MTETEHRIRRSTRYWKTARMKRRKLAVLSEQGIEQHFAEFPCLIAARIAADMSYNMGNNEPGWWIDSWLNYVHQKIMLQYPVMTAAQNRKMAVGPMIRCSSRCRMHCRYYRKGGVDG